MPIALTCTCGAKLEIDDKFAGQTIPCPDCNKPLSTVREADVKLLPISGLAVTSLILALVGGFTIVGSLAAVAFGLLAIRQITREPDKIGGLSVARAGIIVGGVLTFLTLVLLVAGVTLGTDSLLREFRHGTEVDYKTEDDGTFKIPTQDRDLSIKRPSSAWGKMKKTASSPEELLTLISLRDDAHIVVVQMGPLPNEVDAMERMSERLRKSDLVKALDKPPAKAPATEPEPKDLPGAKKKDKTLELRLGSYDRKFLLRVEKIGPDYYLLAGGARAGRFDRLVADFQQTFDSFTALKEKD